MIKLCIFDLDGTLLDTLGTISYYGNEALKKCGIEPILKEDYKYHVGQGIYNLIKNMLNAKNCCTEENFNKVFKIYDDAYNSNTTYKTEVYDGIKELLDNLKRDGIKIAVMSNKPDFATKSVAYDFFGRGYFDIVLGQRENIAIKPDPYSVIEIINKLDVSKEEVIYIGDTSVDMKTGKNAGLNTVGVLWGFRDEKELTESGADLIISNPNELYEYIKEL